MSRGAQIKTIRPKYYSDANLLKNPDYFEYDTLPVSFG